DLITTAKASGVELASIQSHDVKEQTVGVHQYEARPLTAVVTGSYLNLTNFSANLEKLNYPLLVNSSQVDSTSGVATLTVDFDLYSMASEESAKAPAPAAKKVDASSATGAAGLAGAAK